MKNILFICGMFLCMTCKKKHQNVRVIPVKESWIKGELYKNTLPTGAKTTPVLKKTVLITLSGFEGGHLPKASLLALAGKGYDVFSLAYVAPPSVLPDKISKIPIEYLAKAVNWLKTNTAYKDHSIVLLGVSKGAELALLYGSYYQNIDGIIAYSPSCLLLPGITSSSDPQPTQAPWSYQYKPLPFAPVKKLDKSAKIVTYQKYIEPLLKNVEVLKNAMIKVENIRCPLLLLTGTDDKMWGSEKMARLILYKLEANFKPKQAKSVAYEQAGHLFFWFGDSPPSTHSNSWRKSILNTQYQFLLGGTSDGNQQAMQKSQQEVLNFLHTLDSRPIKTLSQ
ncbi:acyl-CoA thioester hydrolase/BAAT C-terminal domain-containing protein [Microscilla marina]|nr:acyl-CoA thioester hydrolase/BAAT C-terminal domain-containing protein [Microscilla marina]